MQPEFFIDRSLGSHQVPAALRDAGWAVRTLAEVFGEQAGQATPDEEWLEYAGRSRLPVLMKDQHIKYRTLERQALVDHKVVAFCLARGGLTATQQVACFVHHQARIFTLSTGAMPALYSVSTHEVRKVSLD